ncbi:TetR/AcrR family transcriptional regulator [Xylophilus sp.]|uniref:TetR/AcrR family transcriptional regulator n=1 Tax=Xylophilus sp. TaxID=2653893 RepID=UPI002D7E9172|nr:helix-turn-helix domain-containing protein [Xylophilus sp.]
MAAEPGLRERKKRETKRLIAQAGIRLFLAHGYEATTLDQVAAEAGISRRTFFSYFESKQDILAAWSEESWLRVADEIACTPAGRTPLAAARDALLTLVATRTNDEAVAVLQLLQSNEGLKSRHHAALVERERTVHAALAALWPDPSREPELRTAAMVAVGAFRLAVEAWRADPAGPALLERARQSFASLDALIAAEARRGAGHT